MLYVSIWNYPGGEALDRVHGYVYPGAVVHYDTFTAMTGASLFGHQRADVVYDKTEGLTEFEGFDFVVTENERVSGEWKVMEIVRGFDGVQVVGVRSYLNQVLRWIKSALVGHITSVPVPVHIKIGPKIWILENQKRIRGNA
ncbi:uncharacterized protein SPPG_02393 [Spizellomyces punctatus DAOM BR117]|uniref:Uncharacterized protein n=1 Tax=Spizellomyces punctatus (strain DAOM BR117) TaxID=645134 RepID=A0A0L0HR58_SPIPD|nr:uncharacterized protein SPPG_02393 [Spizellomyces punctatus DAOM BR117]KND03349.1 hypothetical protein SPPG_02393 [Spizellomyces punctatus DAOM BR117]|eukprot:XP_016611388.1 hypothetical protein SPPG_02393 [Spizellomyces punctatus DAOM BR117]